MTIHCNDNVSTARMRLDRVRILNEIAFLTGDRAHGGPAREGELAELRRLLNQLDQAISAVRPLAQLTIQ
jgi:hypothetical protein